MRTTSSNALVCCMLRSGAAGAVPSALQRCELRQSRAVVHVWMCCVHASVLCKRVRCNPALCWCCAVLALWAGDPTSLKACGPVWLCCCECPCGRRQQAPCLLYVQSLRRCTVFDFGRVVMVMQSGRVSMGRVILGSGLGCHAGIIGAEHIIVFVTRLFSS